ncbi:MAG: ECF transporter S component [Clostridia bacterium]|nr:ECF transporter S component [Clostridia bacterium]
MIWRSVWRRLSFPPPYAIAAAALGGALSDLLGGYGYYAIFTAVIKAAMIPAFTAKGDKLLGRRNLLAALLTVVITPLGYLTADAVVLTLNTPGASLLTAEPWVVAATEAMPFNALQGAASFVLFLGAALALDRLNFKSRLDRRMTR